MVGDRRGVHTGDGVGGVRAPLLRTHGASELANALFLSWGAVLESDPTRRDGVGYVIAAVAGLYTFYYVGFILAGQWAAAWVERRRIARLTGLLAIVGCALVPMARLILWQAAAHPIDTVHYDVVAQPRFALFKTLGLIVAEFLARADVLMRAHGVLIVLLIALAVPIVRTLASREPWDRTETTLTLAVALPLVGLWLLRLLNIIPVYSSALSRRPCPDCS